MASIDASTAKREQTNKIRLYYEVATIVAIFLFKENDKNAIGNTKITRCVKLDCQNGQISKELKYGVNGTFLDFSTKMFP